MKEENSASKTSKMELLGNNPSPFPLLPGFPRLPGINPPTANGIMPTPTSNQTPSMPNLWPFIYNHITNLLPQLSIARMDPLSQVFSLRWNQHQTNMLSVFDKLLQSEAFCDVTLACDGGSLKCHKIVLAASSDYFQKLFIDNNSEHPIVFLKDVQVSQVKAILDYMYKGEVSVAQQELPALLRVAELLRVKGMIEENKDLKVEKEGERKEGRQGSTDSAPPNSVVPPTSSNGHSSTSAPLSPHPPTSRPLVPPPGAIPPNFRPFLTPPGSTSTPPFPMWPLPGLLPGAYNLFNQQRDRKELSPGPKDRHKMGSGSSSDKDLPLPPLIPRDQAEEREAAAKSSGLNGDGSEDDRTPFPHDPRNPYNNDKSPNSQQYAGGAGHGNNGNMKLEGIAGYVPAQRLEWKRYKQYTRNDIMAAIEEVKTGKSALQVSKKFNIPSRTLYDKVKKMGISTGRQQQRKSMNSSFGKGSGQPSGPINDMFSPAAYSAAFPTMNMMGPLHHLPEGMRDLPIDNPYKNLMDKMREVRDDEDSRDTREARDRDEMEMGSGSDRPKPKDLGPMPFSILPPHMLNMMERIKRGEEMEADMKMEREEKERMEASSPMNLSSEREESKRMSEGSFANESPSPGSGDIDSPSQASPPSYSERDRAENLSPDRAQIDIRAQFLADLRRSAGGEAQSPELDLTRSSSEFGLPPRKRKISQEVDARSTEVTSPNLNLQPEHKSLNGLEENNSAVVT